MESWLDEKAALASGLQQSKDLDSTERQLKKSTVLIDDLKHIKHSIELLKKRAKEMENDSNPKIDEIFYRCVCLIAVCLYILSIALFMSNLREILLTVTPMHVIILVCNII